MPLTHRQFAALSAWLSLEWNRPSRSDHYQMATTCTIRAFASGFSKHPQKQKLSDCRLEFKETKREKEREAPASKMEPWEINRLHMMMATSGGRLDTIKGIEHLKKPTDGEPAS